MPTATDVERAHARVAELAGGLYEVQQLADGALLRAEGHMLSVRLEYLDAEQAFLWFALRTTSWDFGGERTDLHDVLSLAIAALLSVTGRASLQMIDEVNPAVPGLEDEIYARFLVPTQPGPIVDLTRRDPLLERLVAVWSIVEATWRALHVPDDCPCEEGVGQPLAPAEEIWVEKVLKALRRKESPRDFASRRAWPEWQYFHVPSSALTVVHAPRLAELLGAAADNADLYDTQLTEEGLFVRTDELTNLISPATVRRAKHVLTRLDDLREGEGPDLIPLEDRVVAVGRRHLISLPADSGVAAFRAGWERLRARTREQLSYFGVDMSFVWAESVPERRFEDLVGELLQRSGRVAWIRQVGSTNDRDRGRDFVAEWVTATSEDALPEGASPAVRVPVVVQCKAFERAVGVNDTAGIVEVVEEHDAHGYFLAVSSHLTGPLVDRLAVLRQRERFKVVDWWGRTEIERELRDAPDVLPRYADVVRAE